MSADHVTIRHPDTGGVAEVHPRSVAHWRRSGWVPADEDPEPEPVTPPDDAPAPRGRTPKTPPVAADTTDDPAPGSSSTE